MLIDWFTVLAQIVNFLILVALMKRFLYGPLVAAIDAREQSIDTRLAEAARKEREAAARIEQAARDAAEIEHRRPASSPPPAPTPIVSAVRFWPRLGKM